MEGNQCFSNGPPGPQNSFFAFFDMFFAFASVSQFHLKRSSHLMGCKQTKNSFLVNMCKWFSPEAISKMKKIAQIVNVTVGVVFSQRLEGQKLKKIDFSKMIPNDSNNVFWVFLDILMAFPGG